MRLFFRLNSVELRLILVVVVFGVTVFGLVLGRLMRHRSEHLREPFGVLQAALLGLVGLVLAFGLALGVGRYEDRRTAVVDDANAIGTTYLRAQTLKEPMRRESLELLKRYIETSIRLSNSVPESARAGDAVADGEAIQRDLWRLAGDSLAESPDASAPRLYVETLNEMIDMQTVRVATLNNRVPGAVLAVEVFGAAIALGLLAFYLSILGRGVSPVLLAAALITMLLLVTFDLDRPTRGLIRVPDGPLTNLRAEMELPPAATGPRPVSDAGIGESRWPPALALLAFLALNILVRLWLPSEELVHVPWLVPAIEAALLVVLIAGHPGSVAKRARWLRPLAVTLVCLLVAAALWATTLLVYDLVKGRGVTNSPEELLGFGAVVWLGNNLSFALLYWLMDSGGPLARLRGGAPIDFAFPQHMSPELAPPGWRPVFLDYLHLGFTNATAFSPTDVMPLSHRAKYVMVVQATVALALFGLIVARAVNAFA